MPVGENLIPTRRFYVLRQPLFDGAAPVRRLLPLLPEEQHAQAAGAAVAGNGAAGHRLNDFLKGVQFLYQRDDLLYDLLRNSGMGHKDPLIIHRTDTFQSAPDIIQNALLPAVWAAP